MCPTAHRPEGSTPVRLEKEAEQRAAVGHAGARSQEQRSTISAVRRLAPAGSAPPGAARSLRAHAAGYDRDRRDLQEVNGVSEDVSKAEGRGVDEPKTNSPRGADSVHEQTREKGERAREECEKIEQQTTREQHERNHKDGLEAPPGD